jgi:proteasome lid subunit RPN8/RPN11
VLVGKWGKDDNGPFVIISAAIRGEAASNKLAEVTFTHETWAKINERMDKEFSSLSIVGWYHTHPDFGIFLSDRDRFIHEHFFNEPGQVAYVVDPIKKQEGMFIWSKGTPTRSPYFWVGGDIKFNESNNQHNESHKSMASKSLSSSSESRRDDDYERDRPAMSWITMALFGICLLIIGYMFRGLMGSAVEQRLVELIQLDRLRINLELSQRNARMQSALLNLSTFAMNPQRLNDPAAQQSFERNMLELQVVAAELEQIRRQYGLDPNQLGQLAAIIAQEQARAAALEAAQTQAQSKTTMPSSGPATQPSKP